MKFPALLLALCALATATLAQNPPVPDYVSEKWGAPGGVASCQPSVTPNTDACFFPAAK